MSKFFCKKASVLGKLAMSAKTVSKPRPMHLRTNNRAILTRLICVLDPLMFIVPSFSVLCFPWTFSLYPLTVSFQLSPFCKSDTAINGDLILLSLLFSDRFQGSGSRQRRGKCVCDTEGAIEVIHLACSREQRGWIKTVRVQCTAHYRQHILGRGEAEPVQTGSTIPYFELLRLTHSESDSDKCSTYGSLVPVTLNDDSSNCDINHH